MGEPYLTADRLEDFRTEAEFDAIYADEQRARLERIKLVINEAVNAAAPWFSRLADLDAIDVCVVGGRAARNGLTREERIAWARTVIRDAFTDTVLSVEDSRALAELE